ncbi:hypothetical protein XcyCFBP4188_12025 [Xanthomonas hortorum pv. cynarae]|nr:hypothetical protein XcyCFBP4188_12025 [Xanthomonas hortorum pv. cynarae]
MDKVLRVCKNCHRGDGTELLQGCVIFAESEDVNDRNRSPKLIQVSRRVVAIKLEKGGIPRSQLLPYLLQLKEGFLTHGRARCQPDNGPVVSFRAKEIEHSSGYEPELSSTKRHVDKNGRRRVRDRSSKFAKCVQLMRVELVGSNGFVGSLGWLKSFLTLIIRNTVPCVQKLQISRCVEVDTPQCPVRGDHRQLKQIAQISGLLLIQLGD